MSRYRFVVPRTEPTDEEVERGIQAVNNAQLNRLIATRQVINNEYSKRQNIKQNRKKKGRRKNG